MSEESVIYPGKMLGQLAIALEKMGWEGGDNVDVEIAGTSVYEMMEAGNKKWATVKFGVVSTTKMRSLLSRTLTVIPLYHHNQTQI